MLKKSALHLAVCIVIILSLSDYAAAQSKFMSTFSVESSQTLPTLPPSNSISHIATQDSLLWIGTSKGLANSYNGGRSWKLFRGNPAFAKDGIFAIAFRDSIAWASTGYVKEIAGGSRIQTGAGYAYSTNYGTTWHHVAQTLDQRSDSLIVYGLDTLRALPVIVPEQNVTFDISLSPGKVWIASWASGLRYSSNSGQSWQRVLLPPDNLNRIAPRDGILNTDTVNFYVDPRRNNNFLAFSVLAIDNDTIWAGTAGGVNKSTDGGRSWTRFTRQNQQSGILGNWVIAIKEQRFGSTRRIWTTNWKAENQDEQQGVSYSDNGGQTWTNLLHGIKAYEFAFKDSIAYIATEEGIYRTADGGRSFLRSGSIVDTETRQRITTSSVYAIGVIGDTIWVGTGDGLASTIDNASNLFATRWKIIRTYAPLSNPSATYAYPNPFSPNFELTRIRFGINGTTVNATVEVFDFGMNPVRTIIRNAVRTGASEFEEMWDGRDNGGRFVANGVYFYRVTTGTSDPAWGKVMVLR